MGKRKRRKTVDKPYCWYCDRHFMDEKILIQHQKAKHFKCHICHKKLSSASGMVVHVFQVHKKTVSKIPNAKPSRDSVRFDVVGMSGIPNKDEEGPPLKKLKSDSELMGSGGLINPLYPPVYPQPFNNMPPYGMPYMPPNLNPIQGMVPQNTNWGYGQYSNQPMDPSSLSNGPPPFPPGTKALSPSSSNSLRNNLQSPLSNPYNPSASPEIGEVHPGTLSGQLFPIQQPSGSPYQGGSPTSGDAAKPQSKVVLVYDNPDVSVEEQRAMLERYSYSKERLQQQADQLDLNIESRIMGMGGLSTLSFDTSV